MGTVDSYLRAPATATSITSGPRAVAVLTFAPILCNPVGQHRHEALVGDPVQRDGRLAPVTGGGGHVNGHRWISVPMSRRYDSHRRPREGHWSFCRVNPIAERPVGPNALRSHRQMAIEEVAEYVLGLGADDGVDDRTVAHHQQHRDARRVVPTGHLW